MRLACAPNVAPNDACCGNLLGDDQRRDLVEVDAAVRLGNVGAEQAQAAALLDQLAIERPLLLLEPLVGRQHLAVDELRGRLPNQLVLVGDLLRRHHGRRIGLLNQPRAALDRLSRSLPLP